MAAIAPLLSAVAAIEVGSFAAACAPTVHGANRCDELVGNIRQLLVVAACMQPGRLAIVSASAR